VQTIDYRLTDIYADPPIDASPSSTTERLFHLNPTAWCFQESNAPPIHPRQNGPFTFGCFNAFAKVTEPMLMLWAKILQRIPDSRLLLKSAALGTESVRRRIENLMQEHGIDPQRIEMRGVIPLHSDHLAIYQQIDIALDTFPYHGTMTTCEALWMGVPVITLAGRNHVSRVGVSLLTNVGLPDLIAKDKDQYIEIAKQLANDLPRLKGLRAGLRDRMGSSPLMDAPRLARNMESAYRQIWKTWCNRP
jgi:protein O-GlcNAc transferase